MTRFWLIILRVISGIQLVLAIFKSFSSLTGLFTEGHFIYLFQAAAFGAIAALPVQIFIIFSINFPDKGINGRQKKNFNRIFLVNFLLIAFLFGFVFKDYKEAIALTKPTGTAYPEFFINFAVSVLMLVFHFIILYGLYWLRSHINVNVNRKHFDFEMQDENQ